MYAKFAKEAREEGFDHIAQLFDGVAAIEKEARGALTASCWPRGGRPGLLPGRGHDLAVLHCGHIVVGKQAPEVCPVCAHPQAYFQIKAENY